MYDCVRTWSCAGHVRVQHACICACVCAREDTRACTQAHALTMHKCVREKKRVHVRMLTRACVHPSMHVRMVVQEGCVCMQTACGRACNACRHA